METWTDAPRSGLITDRAYDADAWRARQGIKTVIPARARRTNPQPHDPERYPARNVVKRNLDWLKRGRRMAIRYGPYAHRCLGSLYLAAAWIWLTSKLNTA